MKKRWTALMLGAVAAVGVGLHQGRRPPDLPPPLVIQSGGKVEKLTLSPDGRLLADDCPQGQVLLYDTETGRQKHAFAVRTNRMVFSPDSRRLLTINRGSSPTAPNGAVQVWDTQTGAQISQFIAPPSHTAGAAADIAAISLDLRWAVVRDGPRCLVYDIPTARLVKALPLLPGQSEIVLSPDRSLLTVSSDRAAGKFQVWNTKTWQPIQTVGSQVTGITGVRFSPDGTRLALGSRAGLAWWNTRTWKPEGQFSLPSPSGLARGFYYFSSDSRSLLVSQIDPATVLHQIDCATGRETLKVPGQLVQHVSLTGNRGETAMMPGKYKFFLFRDNYCFWDTNRKQVLYQIMVPPGQSSSLMGDFQLHSVDLSADGRVFAAGGYDDGMIHVWRLP